MQPFLLWAFYGTAEQLQILAYGNHTGNILTVTITTCLAFQVCLYELVNLAVEHRLYT